MKSSPSTTKLQQTRARDNDAQKEYNDSGLITAIRQKDLPKVQDYLIHASHLLFNKDDNSRTPFHIALQCSSPPIIAAILECLKQLGKEIAKAILTHPDKSGRRPLHIASAYCGPTTVANLIAALEEEAHAESLKITEEGYIPLDLARNRINKEICKGLKVLLKDLTIERTQIDIQSPIKFSEVIQNSSVDESNKDLLMNLHYGCVAASHVRKYIKTYPSHTNSNSLDKKTFSENVNKRNELSKEINKQKHQGPSENTFLRMLERLKIKDSELLEDLKITDSVCKTYALANCDEYARLVLHIINKMGIKSNREIFHVRNGDHVFVVIGRDPKTNPRNYKTWNPETVIVEPGEGKVYPACDLLVKLKVFKAFTGNHKDKHICACLSIFYDPIYHIIDRYLYFSNEFINTPRQPDFSDFTRDELDTIKDNEDAIMNLCPDKLTPSKRSSTSS